VTADIVDIIDQSRADERQDRRKDDIEPQRDRYDKKSQNKEYRVEFPPVEMLDRKDAESRLLCKFRK